MEIVEMLRELGGVARRHQLLSAVERGAIEDALTAGRILRDSRGLYHLPGTDETAVLLTRVGGALSMASAALVHGWAVKSVPDRPHITVSRGRRVPTGLDAHIHYGELSADERAAQVVSPVTALRQCLRHLPFDEALCVADSALREGFDPGRLASIGRAKGPGAPQIAAVARHASGLAANPFETSLRSIAITVPGLEVVPQVSIVDGTFTVRPDLVDTRLRIVLEADSFTWHGQRDALASDTRRYNHLVVRGWLVLRFCYEDVMFHPNDVRAILVAVVRLAELLAQVRRGHRSAA